MALTGLQIFKLLPNTNCGECGVPTCLAFAMKLAAKVAEPAACPYVSESSREVLGASQAPPVKKLVFSLGGKTREIGAETVLYRHEKTFVNPPLVCLEMGDDLPDAEFTRRLAHASTLRFERVGDVLMPDGFGLAWRSGDPARVLQKIAELRDADRVLVLPVLPIDLLARVLEKEPNPSRLLARVSAETDFTALSSTLGKKGVKLVVSADDPEALFAAVQKAEAAGLKDLVLHLRAGSPRGLLENGVLLRRLAVSKGFKPAGYPLLFDCGDELLSGVLGICRYASVIVLKEYRPEILMPLLTLRQNIYTDPQKPLQIAPGVYKVGEPDAESPLLVTTNFSLTYFIVSGEIGNSSHAARLLITDSEGMSVLTAWSANKFSPAIIANAVKGSGVENEIRHRKLIIPGYVAMLKGDLEDGLPGWEVMVGPQEAADIPQFLKEVWGR
jgi:acetyl-CoA decarbonylase/synthase complex subunit gamma